jgi:hypothetical protein
MSTITDERPRFGKIPFAESYSGISRARLYHWAAAHPGLFIKNGRATLCDLSVLDRLLDALPPAEIKAPAPRKPSGARPRHQRK